MIALLFTRWSVGLDSWADAHGCDAGRGPVELTSYLSSIVNDLPGVEETGAWWHSLPTAPARVTGGRITARMHWRLDIPTEPWRDWRAEWDRGIPVQPGVRRDALRFYAAMLYGSGSITPTDAVMTVTRAREGRTAPWRTIPAPVTVHRPETRRRSARA
ncbi:hypothetical protein [Streptomyces luteireticuli]|uniref:hypothetical protein n=1 Tax=Streptomyces luteireticuli TaxID=173858 RepID=UPI0035583D5D